MSEDIGKEITFETFASMTRASIFVWDGYADRSVSVHVDAQGVVDEILLEIEEALQYDVFDSDDGASYFLQGLRITVKDNEGGYDKVIILEDDVPVYEPLLPCPFCGSDKVYETNGYDSRSGWGSKEYGSIECLNCNVCFGARDLGIFELKLTDVRKRWNTRHTI